MLHYSITQTLENVDETFFFFSLLFLPTEGLSPLTLMLQHVRLEHCPLSATNQRFFIIRVR